MGGKGSNKKKTSRCHLSALRFAIVYVYTLSTFAIGLRAVIAVEVRAQNSIRAIHQCIYFTFHSARSYQQNVLRVVFSTKTSDPLNPKPFPFISQHPLLFPLILPIFISDFIAINVLITTHLKILCLFFQTNFKFPQL